jgi:hypothetical protein
MYQPVACWRGCFLNLDSAGYAWRKEFGKELRLKGGIAKQPVVERGIAIDRELERIRPAALQQKQLPPGSPPMERRRPRRRLPPTANRGTKKAGQLTLHRSRSRFLLTLPDNEHRAGGGGRLADVISWILE